MVKTSVLVRATARTQWIKDKEREVVRQVDVLREKAKDVGKGRMVRAVGVRGSVVAAAAGEKGKAKEEVVVDDEIEMRKAFAEDISAFVMANAGLEDMAPGAETATDTGTRAPRSSAAKAKKDVVGLTDLPKELRDEIWRLVVVQPETFIWPDDKFGKEQPDLAMVSRFIRADVLPIYYAENIFALDVSPTSMSLRKPGQWVNARERAEKPSIIETWAAVLETKGWFGMIHKWCLSYEGGSNLFSKKEDRIVLVSLALRQRDTGFWSAEMELHREASCLLPGHADFGKCVVENTPNWLNVAVIDLLDAARGGTVDGGMIMKLARAIQGDQARLEDNRCSRSLGRVGEQTGRKVDDVLAWPFE